MARGKVNETKKPQKKTNRKQDKKQSDKDAAVAAAEKKADASKTVNKITSKKNPRIAKWEEPEKLVLLEGWARDGLSMEQIAKNMGIAKDTLYRWIKISSDISDAIKKGKEVTDYLVENALFANCLAGNVVAQIFWLKNRKPDRWKDKVDVNQDVEVESGGVIMLAPVLEANHVPESEDNMGTPAETN